MSVMGDLAHKVKKGVLLVFGPADLDPSVDPVDRLDREHDDQVDDPGPGKDWDRG